jgi:hypothetical protein
MWQEATVAYFNVLSSYFLQGSEENFENLPVQLRIGNAWKLPATVIYVLGLFQNWSKIMLRNNFIDTQTRRADSKLPDRFPCCVTRDMLYSCANYTEFGEHTR